MSIRVVLISLLRRMWLMKFTTEFIRKTEINFLVFFLPLKELVRLANFAEYYSKSTLKGGTFKIRDLLTKKESTLHLPNDLMTFLYSSNHAQFKAAQNCYFRPVSQIFESVDSFIKPNLLFQMTGTKNHPCKQTGLCDVLNILHNPLEPKLYFVVPPDRFASFRRQSYHGTDGTEACQCQ